MAKALFEGHASFRFTLDDGTVVYLDPFAGNEYDIPADLILVTHEHFDHDQVASMPHADGCTIIRAKDVHPSEDEYLSTESHGVKIQAVEAYNAHHPKADCVGYVLELDGKTFYASGDTSMTDDMKDGKLASMDLDYATFPCDGEFNMDVKEASECAKLVAAKHSIPIHMSPVHTPAETNPEFMLNIAEEFDGPGKLIMEPDSELTL